MTARTCYVTLLLCLLAVAGCQEDFGLSLGGEGADTDRVAEAPPLAPGASCQSTRDCEAGRVCVERACRPQATSVAGEILASLAAAQLASGDARGAAATYGEALQAFETAQATAPPALLCGAANATMRAAQDAAAREAAARMADRCFRGSLPGDPSRAPVQETLGQMRFEGLWLAAFDEASPAAQFFTARPSRPSADAVEVDIQLPENSAPSFQDAAQKIRSADTARAVADCFLQDWELRHEASASASYELSFRARMRDMGDYDAYFGAVTLRALGGAADGFEPCVGSALEAALGAGEEREARGGNWTATAQIRATLRR